MSFNSESLLFEGILVIKSASDDVLKMMKVREIPAISGIIPKQTLSS